MPRWRWILTHLSRQLWVRATLIGLLGVAAAIIAAVTERFIPWELPTTIGADSVESILTIIASSMLAVTTFSLSVMTAAFGAAASNVSPRATRLLMEDSLTQNVLSTFIGSFLFSMVGIVVLKTGAYGDRGRFILFVVTVVVIVLIVISLLRWINHLTRFGRTGETTDRVEQAVEDALRWRLDNPYLGGRPLEQDALPAGPRHSVRVNRIGYVQHVDISALADLAERLDIQISLDALPGTFIYPHTDLAHLHLGGHQPLDEDDLKSARHAFTISKERAFDQDPRFGLAVMSEIGSKALSAAINDPGTVIDVIGRIARLMHTWSNGPKPDQAPPFPRLHVPALQTEDMFEDAFALIARDGAALVEVQVRLQKTLAALGQMGDASFRQAAARQAELALERAELALPLAADRQRVRDAASGAR